VPKLEKMQRRLELSDAELKKMLISLPQILSYSYEDNIVPSLEKLQCRLGLSDAELKKMIISSPPIIGYSYEGNIVPKLEKIQHRLGLSDAELKKMIISMPQILGLSYEDNIAPKISFIASELDLSREELCAELMKISVILGSSLENTVKPNVALWKAGLPDGDVKAVVVVSGLRFLCCSYRHKTFPRAEAFRLCGLALSNLPSKMTMPDVLFEEWLCKNAHREGVDAWRTWAVKYRSGLAK